MAENEQAPQPAASGDDAEKNKVNAILAYLGILVLVPILTAKESPFAKFHANQGLSLVILDVAVWFVQMVLIFSMPLLFMVFWLVWLGVLVLHIIGIVNAANGEMKPLPLIGGLKLLK